MSNTNMRRLLKQPTSLRMANGGDPYAAGGFLDKLGATKGSIENRLADQGQQQIGSRYQSASAPQGQSNPSYSIEVPNSPRAFDSLPQQQQPAGPSALEQRLNSNMLAGKMSLRQAGMLSDIENQRRGDTTQRYGIDTQAATADMTSGRSLQGQMYGADRSLEGQKYSSDKSLEGQKYSADKSYAATDLSSGRSMQASMYNADKSYAATDLSSGRSLAGSMYNADRSADASMYNSDSALRGQVYNSDMRYKESVGNNMAQRYSADASASASRYGSNASMFNALASADASRYGSNASMFNALASADASRYGSDSALRGQVYGSDMRYRESVGNNMTQRYSADAAASASRYASNNSLLASQGDNAATAYASDAGGRTNPFYSGIGQGGYGSYQSYASPMASGGNSNGSMWGGPGFAGRLSGLSTGPSYSGAFGTFRAKDGGELHMAEGGFFDGVKRAIGMKEESPELKAYKAEQATKAAAAKNPQPAPQPDMIRAGGEALKGNTRAAQMKELGLRDGGSPAIDEGHGGPVPGRGQGDKIPAKYEPGEFVVSNDMLEAAPSLRGELRSLREQVLAQKGMTPEQADAKAVKGGGLRAEEGGAPVIVDVNGNIVDAQGNVIGGTNGQVAQGVAQNRVGQQTAGNRAGTVAAGQPTSGVPGGIPRAELSAYEKQKTELPAMTAVADGAMGEVKDAWGKGNYGTAIGHYGRGMLAMIPATISDTYTRNFGEGKALHNAAQGVGDAAYTLATGQERQAAVQPPAKAIEPTALEKANAAKIAAADAAEAAASKGPSYVTSADHIEGLRMANEAFGRTGKSGGQYLSMDDGINTLRASDKGLDLANKSWATRGLGVQASLDANGGLVLSDATGPQKRQQYTGRDGAPTLRYEDSQQYADGLRNAVKTKQLADTMEQERLVKEREGYAAQDRQAAYAREQLETQKREVAVSKAESKLSSRFSSNAEKESAQRVLDHYAALDQNKLKESAASLRQNSQNAAHLQAAQIGADAQNYGHRLSADAKRREIDYNVKKDQRDYADQRSDKGFEQGIAADEAQNKMFQNMFRTRGSDGKDVADTSKIARYTANVQNTIPDMIEALRQKGTPEALAKAAELSKRGMAALDKSDHAKLAVYQDIQDRAEQTHGSFVGSTHKKSASLMSYAQKPGTDGSDGNYVTINGTVIPLKHMMYDEPGNLILPDWFKKRTDQYTRGANLTN